MLSCAWCFNSWNYAASVWTTLNQYDAKTKAGPGSTFKDSRRSFKWVETMCICCRQSHASPLTGCNGLTTLALIQGDTQPPNLLSAQFQWTMEFRARRYTTLLTALRLAARLMRWRPPTGEPNGVKTKVLLLDKQSFTLLPSREVLVSAQHTGFTQAVSLNRHKVSERVCRLQWILWGFLNCIW